MAMKARVQPCMPRAALAHARLSGFNPIHAYLGEDVRGDLDLTLTCYRMAGWSTDHQIDFEHFHILRIHDTHSVVLSCICRT